MQHQGLEEGLPLASRHKAIEASEAGCYLNLEILPGSKESKILDIDPWRHALRISISSPPVSGKANSELLNMFEKIFPESKGMIVLAKGGKSRSKRLFIPLSEQVIRERLGLKDDR